MITSFWHCNWVNGLAPKNIAPLLFDKSSRENIIIQKAVQNNKWIDHISRINSREEIIQFVTLWSALEEVVLDQDKIYTIWWRWTHLATSILLKVLISSSSKGTPLGCYVQYRKQKHNKNVHSLLDSHAYQTIYIKEASQMIQSTCFAPTTQKHQSIFTKIVLIL